jgi:hypothetical protein
MCSILHQSLRSRLSPEGDGGRRSGRKAGTGAAVPVGAFSRLVAVRVDDDSNAGDLAAGINFDQERPKLTPDPNR